MAFTAALNASVQSPWAPVLDGVPAGWPAFAAPRPELPYPNIPAALVSVHDAAVQLGVHENTIRNWTDRGILMAIRLPASGHRRLDAGAVAELRRSLANQLSPAAQGGAEAVEDDRATNLTDGAEGFQGAPEEGW